MSFLILLKWCLIPSAIFAHFFQFNLEKFVGAFGVAVMYYVAIWLFFPDPTPDPMVVE